jgi:DNA invertase Pin-like site-specific DNA recombinase
LKLLANYYANVIAKMRNEMAILGYARVSTNGQTLVSQDAQLMAAGCAKVYAEKVSGAKTDRPELAKLLRRLGRDACSWSLVLTAWRVRRATCSTFST